MGMAFDYFPLEFYSSSGLVVMDPEWMLVKRLTTLNTVR
jgi:hypothetical protein